MYGTRYRLIAKKAEVKDICRDKTKRMIEKDLAVKSHILGGDCACPFNLVLD